jgi:hypothetical protein
MMSMQLIRMFPAPKQDFGRYKLKDDRRAEKVVARRLITKAMD